VDHLAKSVEQDGVIDGGEMTHDVQAQYVAEVPGEGLQPIDRSVGAFTEPVGVAVGNEAALEPGFDDVAQGVVDDPVAKRGGTDQTPLGLMDHEMGIAAWAPASLTQDLLQVEQLVGQPMFKMRGPANPSLAAAGLAPGIDQVVPSSHAFDTWRACHHA
jgi:hypothetical protein